MILCFNFVWYTGLQEHSFDIETQELFVHVQCSLLLQVAVERIMTTPQLATDHCQTNDCHATACYTYESLHVKLLTRYSIQVHEYHDSISPWSFPFHRDNYSASSRIAGCRVSPHSSAGVAGGRTAYRGWHANNMNSPCYYVTHSILDLSWVVETVRGIRRRKSGDDDLHDTSDGWGDTPDEWRDTPVWWAEMTKEWMQNE